MEIIDERLDLDSSYAADCMKMPVAWLTFDLSVSSLKRSSMTNIGCCWTPGLRMLSMAWPRKVPEPLATLLSCNFSFRYFS